MRSALLSIALWLCPVLAHGTQDIMAPWHEVSVVAMVDGVPVRAEAKADGAKITFISLVLGARKIIVPPSEYHDLAFPHLRSFEIVYSPGEAKWSAGIRFHYGDRGDARAESDLNEVTFGFSPTAYELRWTRERISADTWQHFQKRPGLPVEKMGVERMIGSVK